MGDALYLSCKGMNAPDSDDQYQVSHLQSLSAHISYYRLRTQHFWLYGLTDTIDCGEVM